MVHLKRSILLLAAILAIQFLQPDGLFAANSRVKAKPKPKPKAKAGLTAKSALVMNMNTGEILFSKKPDEPIAPASLTKILSLYLIYEALGEGKVRTSDIVQVSSTVSQVNGSRMRIRPGSQIALGELMKGMAIMSANDASVAAAEYLGGDVDEFVRRMNVKALELGMTGSHFSNPSGLREEGQVTTARDILTLSCAYINRFPQSLEMHSLPVFEYGRRIRSNTNHLLETNHYVDGLKTGHVAGSGYHLVVTARKNGTRIVAVVLGSSSSGARFREARSLLEQGFKAVQAPAPAKRMAGVEVMQTGSEMGRGRKSTGGFGDS
jgi:D-alanyl-D-alanine carboxypeptidase